MTCKMVVRWKNGAAPMVVPGIRVGIVRSDFVVRVAICDGLASKTHNVIILTRETPGEGLASVLIIIVSISAANGPAAFS